MSSLPKRSGSNCSFSKGDDQISVRKIQDDAQDVEGRKSGVDSICCSEASSSPSGDVGDIAIHDSCVLRHFSKHKSSHLRFLAWVAYTRKYADESITNEERRTCPLLWCRMEFVDQEAMLNHVWKCPHLSQGSYWCFHCQKSEKLGKFHKRCQGLPSRTERLATVAKRIFSKLGAGHHKKASDALTGEDSFSLSDSWKSRDLKSSKGSFSYAADWDSSHIPELPDTSICPEMAGDWTAGCHELPDSAILEMMGTECTTELGNGGESYPDNFYAETFDESNDTLIAPKSKITSPKLPRLDTTMASLNAPIQWLNHAQSSQQVSPSGWSDGLSSSSIVSPMSAIGTFNGNYTLDISPTDSEASGQSFFSDSGYTSATSQSVWDMSTGSFSRVPSFNEPKGTKRSWDCAAIAEEHRNNITEAVAPILFPVSVPQFDQAFTESLNSTPSVSRSSSNASDKSRARDLSPHWSDAPSLVSSFSDVLDAHISHTKDTLRQLPSNSVTSELLAMSKTSLVSIGIEVLAGILEGRNPTPIVHVFAFAHIACACSIVMNHDSGHVHTKQWFQDSLSWVAGLGSERQRQLYTHIATSIWQPTQAVEDIWLLQPGSSPSKANQLLLACQQFLDILESFDNEQKESLEMSTPSTGFNFAQLSFEYKAKSRVVDKLITISGIEAFISSVVRVEKRLQQGQISTIRELELDLICAGKLSSQSDIAYSRFVGHVIRLCDELYSEEPSESRTAYHIQDISLFKRYLPEEIYVDDEQVRDDVPALDVNDDFQLDFDFDAASKDTEESVAVFSREADEVMNVECAANTFQPSPAPPVPTNYPKPPPFQATSLKTYTPRPSHLSAHPSTLPSPVPTPMPITPSQPSNKYRCHCGYNPSGEEKWKASNLRRHKRTQHSTGTKVYKCRWPGCKSEFTRSDNLRSHQRDKGHGGGIVVRMGVGEEEEEEAETKDENGRGLKRRKINGGEVVGRGN